MTDSTEPPPTQGEALNALAATLVTGLGIPQDWAEMRAVLKPAAGPSDGTVHLALRRTLSGQVRNETAASVLPAGSVPAEQALDVQRAMSGPDGAWLELMITLRRSADGSISADANANYHREPGALTSEDRPFDADAVHDHLARFPREDSAVPAWMRERVAGRADGPAGS